MAADFALDRILEQDSVGLGHNPRLRGPVNNLIPNLDARQRVLGRFRVSEQDVCPAVLREPRVERQTDESLLGFARHARGVGVGD
jgi:hypothetical protein